MTKEEYAEALKSPKWAERRATILKLDNYKCTKCGTNKNLEVHHLAYLQGGQPWEVPNSWLTTLCRTHHQEAHEGTTIRSYKKAGDWDGKTKPVKKSYLPQKELEDYRYIAVKTKKESFIVDVESKWKRSLKRLKIINIKGFDDKISARKWLKGLEPKPISKPLIFVAIKTAYDKLLFTIDEDYYTKYKSLKNAKIKKFPDRESALKWLSPPVVKKKSKKKKK